MHAIAHPPAGLFGVAFLQAMRRALPQLLIATIAAGLATYIAQSWVAPTYVAEARLVVSASNRAAVEAHVDALKSTALANAVASELGLQDHPEFNTPGWVQTLLEALDVSRIWGGDEQTHPNERVLAGIQSKFEVAVDDREKGEIAVRFIATEPELAAKLVNRIVELYLESREAREISGAADGIRVVTWAEEPQQATTPRKGLMAILGMVVMLLLCLGAIAVREALLNASGRRDGDDEKLGLTARRSISATGAGNLGSVAAIADRILAIPTTDRGCRIMVAGEDKDIEVADEARVLADALSSSGRKVVLVRWGLGGGDVNGRKSGHRLLGLNDLLEGRATFEEIVMRLPGSSAHAIAAGSPVTNRKAALDPDLVGLVLDTLDEVYDYIVVVAEHEEAVELFATLEGRFDACVSIGEKGRNTGRFTAGVDRFLGFEVVDIHIVRLEREQRISSVSGGSLALQARWA
jgi:hypothetical protein